ncbi:MAG: phosphonate C-P lyase system protein PhnH, partial [Thermodesulfobacteriota bacterium]|nr:phosphonate C-P lyase system protein PhnH [Thermodesulfobacteriota bacterium]
RLSGPGIEDNIYPKIDGLAAQELNQLKEVNTEYPLGIDCIFIDQNGQLMCIPRSTRIGEN